MTTSRSAMASPFSMRVDSEVISIGTSPKLPNCAQAPVAPNNKSAREYSSRFMRGGEATGALRSLPREKAVLVLLIPVAIWVAHVPCPRALNDPVDGLEFRLPAQLALHLVRAGDQSCRVTRPARFFHHRNLPARHPFASRHDF